MFDDLAAIPPLPPRDPNGHKGTFGSVLIVGGRCDGIDVMVGGPSLCALAALRTGCGLAWLAVPRPVVDAALAIVPEATAIALPVDELNVVLPSAAAEAIDARIQRARVCAVGPGLGTSLGAQQVVMRLASGSPIPLVLDADALNCLAMTPQFALDLQATSILTPHPGEFERLASALDLSARLDVSDPASMRQCAQALATRLACVVILKGSLTTVATTCEVWQVHAGTAALATGGSGDVLTGICASIVAQFGPGSPIIPTLSLFDCARVAVTVHGLSASRWSHDHGTAGLLARDLIDRIPDVMRDARLKGWGAVCP